MSAFTLDDFVRVMRECAGEDESVDLDGDIAAAEFEALGYDSLALMEAASRVAREFHVVLPEEPLADVRSPAEFVAFVNQRLAAARPGG